jgi:hypothetical protein
LGNEIGFDRGRKEKVRDSEAILTTRMQMLRARMGCETGRVSLFLCLDVE